MARAELMPMTGGGTAAAWDRLKVIPGGSNRHRWRYGVIGLAAAFGLITSVGMFLAIGDSQQRLAELRFANLASDHLQAINAGLGDANDLLYAIRAFLESLDHAPSRSEYEAFSSGLRGRVAGLRDTGWAPRVTAAEREAFEQNIRASGLPDFEITERDTAGNIIRAQSRPEYFPILYLEPGAINRNVLGFDLLSEVARSGAIARARATGRPAATPPLKLINMQGSNGGMMSFMPVDGRSEAVGEGLRPIAGVVLGAFETAAMIENILAATLQKANLNVYAFDPNGPPGKRLIYWHSARNAPAPAEASLLAGLHWQGTLELVDQHWATIFTPTDGYDAGNSGSVPLAVLTAGLIMTASIVWYLWFSLHRTQQLETLTTNLRETTAELRRNGAKLDHMARHDSLTGLPNRTAFHDDVAAALRRARRGDALAVLYLDLDRFKTVNDTLGHPIGDLLLCQVADRLRETVRESDTISRLGGDEFGIAQYGAEQPRSAQALARRLIETLSRPYSVAGQHVAVGASIGITLSGRDQDDVDQLLRRADVALYAAKRDGRGAWRCFEADMDREALARHGMEMDLRDALESGSLELYYQPQVRISDGRICGFEALLRWHHPERGFVLPGEFITCAEETGLIGPIGEWVVRTALAQAASWPKDVRVSVNLSPYQLARDTLVTSIEAALAETGQAGERLELEITETALLQNYAAGEATMKRLRSQGVSIAMDDFGIGYASLSHLRLFPFDRLKIDQSFIFAMLESPEGGAIVTAILQLAAGLNIATTAEGVETRAQLDRLAAGGCDEAQGFLFSRPQPASEVPRLLAAWHLAGVGG